MENLIEFRKQIDKIDKQIAAKLLERIELVQSLHKKKLSNNQNIIDISREHNIIDNITSDIIDNEQKILIKNIYLKLLQEIKVLSYAINNEIISTIFEQLSQNKLIIAGPCSIENQEQISLIAQNLARIGISFIRGGIFKARTSPNSFQGLGEKGLEIFYNSAKENKLNTVSEFLDIEQAKSYFEYFDVIIVGSRNMTNFEFLRKLGKLTSANHKPIILKRGFASTVDELLSAAQYITNEGNPNVILCLRGIRTFEQTSEYFRFTPDFHSLLEIRDKSNFFVIFDPSHSAGNRKIVEPLSRMAIDLKFNGLIIEAHNNPDEAWSDANQTVSLDSIERIFKYTQKNRQ